MSEAKTDKPIKKRKIKLDEELLAYKGVWVFVESERGHVHPVSWELMGQGRRIMVEIKKFDASQIAQTHGLMFCQGQDLIFLQSLLI